MSDQRAKVNLEDAERFQRLFVSPMVVAVKGEVESMCNALKSEFANHVAATKELSTKVDTVQADVNNLKSNQKKALVGWGVFATGIAAGISFGWNYIKSIVTIKS